MSVRTAGFAGHGELLENQRTYSFTSGHRE
jgi:hypothetical protein